MNRGRSHEIEAVTGWSLKKPLSLKSWGSKINIGLRQTTGDQTKGKWIRRTKW